jgi:tRNA(Ile2) C34 agmatinyltransferase TiaS
MFDRVRALELIERAIDHHPYCPVCGSSTEVVDAGHGRLVLRCREAAEADGVLARIGAAVLPHVHQVIVELEEGIAA